VLLIGIVVLVDLTGYQLLCSSARIGRSSCAGCRMIGIMWIGLLWYLNFVQTGRCQKSSPPSTAAAITKTSSRALCSGSAMPLATVVFELLLALMTGYLLQALTFQRATVDIGIACGRR
jgi:hypothetical protein